MSFESSSHLPGGFQIRHRAFGIFQGSAIEAYVAYLSSPACPETLDQDDLTIEAYDLAEHERMLNDHPLPSAWEGPT